MARYRRKPGVIVKSLDDEILLVDENEDSIFNLNQMGAAVWNYLNEPRRDKDVIDVLTAAFPDVPTDVIARDTDTLLQRLVDKGLLAELPE